MLAGYGLGVRANPPAAAKTRLTLELRPAAMRRGRTSFRGSAALMASPAGLSSLNPCATAHRITAAIRWRTCRASVNRNATPNREVLSESFSLSDDLRVAPGSYDFDYVLVSYQAGPQRPVSGNFAYQQGGFFSGMRRELAWRGRIELMTRLTVEPTVSVNWITLPESDYDTNLLAARINCTVSPRSFVAALLQYNSVARSLSTNVRFRPECEPGSDLYVVYNSLRDTLDPGTPN